MNTDMKVIFEVIKILEFEILSENEKIRGRVELLQNLNNPNHFRFNTLESDMFRLKLSFPERDEGRLFDETDEVLWALRTFPKMVDKEFFANDTDEAVRKMLSMIESFYKHLLLL
jgi:hypothetical protein